MAADWRILVRCVIEDKRQVCAGEKGEKGSQARKRVTQGRDTNSVSQFAPFHTYTYTSMANYEYLDGTHIIANSVKHFSPSKVPILAT